MGRVAVEQERIEAFCRKYRIRSFAFYGSVIREDFGPGSDVDVLVEFEPDARVSFITLSKMQRELSTLLRRRVDLVTKTGLKPLRGFTITRLNRPW